MESPRLALRLVNKKATVMDNYLRELAARILRLSRSTLDIGTGQRLRQLSKEVSEKAVEAKYARPPLRERAPARCDR